MMALRIMHHKSWFQSLWEFSYKHLTARRHSSRGFPRDEDGPLSSFLKEKDLVKTSLGSHKFIIISLRIIFHRLFYEFGPGSYWKEYYGLRRGALWVLLKRRSLEIDAHAHIRDTPSNVLMERFTNGHLQK